MQCMGRETQKGLASACHLAEACLMAFYKRFEIALLRSALAIRKKDRLLIW